MSGMVGTDGPGGPGNMTFITKLDPFIEFVNMPERRSFISCEMVQNDLCLFVFRQV
jgi:hypothetical protein